MTKAIICHCTCEDGYQVISKQIVKSSKQPNKNLTISSKLEMDSSTSLTNYMPSKLRFITCHRN